LNLCLKLDLQAETVIARQAWLLEHKASATIGFKLAFNYLKAKRFVEAIDVCNKILVLYPDYPKIRQDVLDNAITGLRA